MRSERWRLVNPHLDRALDLSGEERRGYLAVLASEDSTLAADLESLLGEERALREEKYLAIRRKVLGPVHHETGTSLSDLGLLLRKKGDSSGAEALLRQALEVTRTSSGPRHPDVGTSLSSLAMTLDERGDYRAAEAMLRESLDIVQDSLGREHPGNAQKLANLACVLRAQGQARGGEKRGGPRPLPAGVGNGSPHRRPPAETEPCLLRAAEILERGSADRSLRRAHEARDNRARLATLHAAAPSGPRQLSGK